MIPDKYKSLIEKLIKKSQAKQVIWSKTSREDEYQLDFSTGAITTDKWSNAAGNFADLRVWNNQGEVIDSLSYNSTSPYYPQLASLHDEAKRRYYKVDETIANMFDELNKEGTIGRQDDDDLPF